MTEIKIISEGSEIVTLSDAKDYIRIDFSDDDSIITSMITQSRIYCENYISRDIVSKEREYYLADAEGLIIIPFGPNSSINSVKNQSDENVEHDVKGLNKEQILIKEPTKGLKINYNTSGLDNSLIKQCILQLTSTYYDNRSDIAADGKSANLIPTNVKEILTSYKNMFI